MTQPLLFLLRRGVLREILENVDCGALDTNMMKFILAEPKVVAPEGGIFEKRLLVDVVRLR